MDLVKFKERICAFDKKILRNISDPLGESLPVADGIVNPGKYLTSKYKILWIMKEANDPPKDGNKRGGWDMRKFMHDVTGYENWKRTYQPIIQSTYGIFNEFCNWNDVPDITKENEKKMISLLHEIAFINLNKLPGLSTSWWEAISEAYKKNREIILEQIEIINPEIIIGGSTLQFLCQDLKVPPGELEHDGSYFTKERVYIDTYHPNQRRMKHEVYYEDIVMPVKHWVENYRKD